MPTAALASLLIEIATSTKVNHIECWREFTPTDLATTAPLAKSLATSGDLDAALAELVRNPTALLKTKGPGGAGPQLRLFKLDGARYVIGPAHRHPEPECYVHADGCWTPIIAEAVPASGHVVTILGGQSWRRSSTEIPDEGLLSVLVRETWPVQNNPRAASGRWVVDVRDDHGNEIVSVVAPTLPDLLDVLGKLEPLTQGLPRHPRPVAA